MLRLITAVVMMVGLSAVAPAAARADGGDDLSQRFSALQDELPVLAARLAQARRRGIAVDYPTTDYSTISRFISVGTEAVTHGQTAEAQYIAGVLENLYTQASSEVQSYLDGTAKPLVAPHYVTGSKPVKVKGRSFIGDTKVQGGRVKSDQDVFLTGYLDGTNPDADGDMALFQKLGNNALQFEIGPDETIFPAATPGWQPSAKALQTTFARDTTTAHTGQASLEVAPQSTSTGPATGTLTERFATKPNTTYHLSVWSKGTNAGGGVSVVVQGATNNPTAMSAQTALPTGTYDWEKQTFSYTTAVDESSVTIAVSAKAATGSTWIDDISAVPAGGSHDAIDNGGFEKAGPANAPFVLDTTLIHTRAARILASAAQNNVAVNVLLSPHDMPQFLYDETPNFSVTSAGFIGFDVNNPVARQVISTHIHAVMSVIKPYPSLQSVVLTNEPDYINSASSQYTQDMWHQYLEKLYPTVAAMNSTWGTSYTSFDAVPPSTGAYQATPYFYDWVQFNNQMFADWHTWMEKQVHRVDPAVPTQAKIIIGQHSFGGNIGGGQGTLGYGVDPVQFDELGQIDGDDNYSWLPGGPTGDLLAEEGYDLQSSTTAAPVFNSEDHITPDGDADFEPAQAANARLSQWQGAIHGRSGSTIWLWAQAFNSQLIRPDVVDAVGRTGLDLNRLANQVTAFQNATPKVGILYSTASELYTPADGYVNATNTVYQALAYDGQKPGFVTEDQAAEGGLDKFKVLILPDTTHVDPATLEAIHAYEQNGGKVVTLGTGLLAADEHDKALDATTRQDVLNAAAQQFGAASSDTVRTTLLDDLEQWGDQEVTLIDADTNQPATGIEYETATYHGQLLLNIANLDKAATRHVYVEVEGKRVTKPVADLLSGSKVGAQPVTLSPLSPVLLKLSQPAVPQVGLVASTAATQVARGQSVPVTLTVRNNTHRSVSGSVSLTAAYGVTVSPASRSVDVPAGGLSTAAFTVTATSGSADVATLSATADLGHGHAVDPAHTTLKVVDPIVVNPRTLDLVAGKPSPVSLPVTNNLDTAVTATVQLTPPDGWTVQPQSLNVSLAAGQSTTVAVTVTPPAGLIGTPVLQAVVDGAGTTSTIDVPTTVSKPIAFVGTQDASQDEFALAPNGYASYPTAFPNDVDFTAGTSDPATDWSYLQPGPMDAWAGSRAHTFTFRFNLDQAPTTDLSFTAWLLDTNPFYAPTLQVGLNGADPKAVALPAGGGDGFHWGDGAPNQYTGIKPTSFQVALPASGLQAGMNTVTLTDSSGSWLTYDAFGVLQRP